MRSSRQRVRLQWLVLMPTAALRGKHQGAGVIKSLRSLAVRSFASIAKPMAAVGLLLNLEAAQQGRSMLLSGEQNLLLKERKRGLHRTPKWIL
jgi:hypothetical protein